MQLKNGYKVMYEVLEEKENVKYRTFKASKTGSLEGADVIDSIECGKYKFIYQKGDEIFGSTGKGPSESDDRLDKFDLVFKTATETVTASVEETVDPEEEVTESVEEVTPEEPKDELEGEEIPEE